MTAATASALFSRDRDRRHLLLVLLDAMAAAVF
jgi:hypothetical protein